MAPSLPRNKEASLRKHSLHKHRHVKSQVKNLKNENDHSIKLRSAEYEKIKALALTEGRLLGMMLVRAIDFYIRHGQEFANKELPRLSRK